MSAEDVPRPIRGMTAIILDIRFNTVRRVFVALLEIRVDFNRAGVNLVDNLD